VTLHPAMAAFEVCDGNLLVGGVPLPLLAERIGSTPFFAYDRRAIDRRVAELRAALPASVALHYAVKANPMPAVVQHLAGLVDGFDVASSGELKIVLDTPMAATDIGFAGPGKTDAELRQAIAAGVTIELESAGEARRVTEIGAKLGQRPRVAIRVNPGFQVRGSGMRMGGGAQQFGVDAEEVPALIGDLCARGLDMQGFHVFAGSQNLNAEIIAEAQRQTVDLVLHLAQHCADPVRYLNLGGGFGIPYFEGDRPLDLTMIGDGLHGLIDTAITPGLPQARIVIELGRYLVGECGYYVTRVVDRKVSRGKTFLVVDGGLHHQLAASGNFGQAIRRNYPLVVGNRMDQPAGEPVTVVGCLCTPLDLLGDNVALPAADAGDLIVILQSGAYGMTASPTAFLGHPAPAEALL
jgi:diaminopimelate decarboxylase